MNRLYICNGEKPDCKKTGCAWLHEEGLCFHTSNADYALNPEGERKFDRAKGEEWETMTKWEMFKRFGFQSSIPFGEDEEADADFVNTIAMLRKLFKDYGKE